MIAEANLSIDKIKIIFVLKKAPSEQEHNVDILIPTGYRELKFWKSNKIGTYSYNLNIISLCESKSVYMGFRFNGCSAFEDNKKAVLEYNPNKVDDIEKVFANYLFLGYKPSSISSLDLAVDLPYSSDDVQLHLLDNRCDLMFYGKAGNMTRYVSPKGEYRMKVYDKAKEQKVNRKWTRAEVTVKRIAIDAGCNLSQILKICERFNSVYVPQIVPLEINTYGLNNCICYLLSQAGDDVRNKALSLMDKKTRLKYKVFIDEHTSMRSIDVEPIDIIGIVQEEIKYITNFFKKHK